MDDQISISILLDIMRYCPCIILGIYVAVYSILYTTKYLKIEKNKRAIRAAILDHWKAHYRYIDVFINDVPIKDIRLLAISDKKQVSSFRWHQFGYSALCIVCLIFAIISDHVINDKVIAAKYLVLITYVTYIISAIYLIDSWILASMSYYEWKFYDRLETLNEAIPVKDLPGKQREDVTQVTQ